MKIAYLNPGGTIGGAEMCLLDVLASLPAVAPHAAPLVILGGDGPLRGEIEALGILCEVLPLPNEIARLGDAGATRFAQKFALARRGLASVAATYAYTRKLARTLRAHRVDLVQSNGMKMHLLGTWAAARAVPVVWHLHDFPSGRAAMTKLLRLTARKGVHVVAVSEAVAADARRVLGTKAAVHAIHNAVDVARFHPGPEDPAFLDMSAGFRESETPVVRVGLVATFATWKGHDVFLEAISRIPADRPARFYVVGGPIYQSAGSQATLDDLKQRAKELGVADRVGFTGYQADTPRVLRALDVVVHASTRPEPFGRVIVEGMSCGRAVIAMTEGGAAELFRHEQDALGCAPRDPAALAAAMLRLIDDGPSRAQLGMAGRDTVLSRFDRTGLAVVWRSVYDQTTPAASENARRGSFSAQSLAPEPRTAAVE